MPPVKKEKLAKAHIPKQHSPGGVGEHMMLFNLHAPGGPYLYKSPKRNVETHKNKKNSVARALSFNNNSNKKNNVARRLFGGKRRKTLRRR